MGYFKRVLYYVMYITSFIKWFGNFKIEVTVIDLTAKLRVLSSSQLESTNSTMPDGLNTGDRPDWSVVYRNGSQNVSQALLWVSNPRIRLLENDFNPFDWPHRSEHVQIAFFNWKVSFFISYHLFRFRYNAIIKWNQEAAAKLDAWSRLDGKY